MEYVPSYNTDTMKQNSVGHNLFTASRPVVKVLETRNMNYPDFYMKNYTVRLLLSTENVYDISLVK